MMSSHCPEMAKAGLLLRICRGNTPRQISQNIVDELQNF